MINFIKRLLGLTPKSNDVASSAVPYKLPEPVVYPPMPEPVKMVIPVVPNKPVAKPKAVVNAVTKPVPAAHTAKPRPTARTAKPTAVAPSTRSAKLKVVSGANNTAGTTKPRAPRKPKV